MNKLLMVLMFTYGCAADHVPRSVCQEQLINPPSAFPLEVVIDTQISNHNISLFLDAIDTWNAAVGEEILFATITQDLTGMHNMCNYTTVTTDKLPPPIVGLTTSWKCSANHVAVETMDLYLGEPKAAYFTDDVVTQITVHELGHVLGLPHENDLASIMYPSVILGARVSAESVCLVELAVALSKQKQPFTPEIGSL